eukprot:gb/GEZN01000006.1/.p1 GENE.gb/GEZN01000006.1/~~gb/GEZN01000006.1/.p1  ORF type:complete len:5009 (-),score=356.70 gb/GEZN01000006.1/:1439-15883(-)
MSVNLQQCYQATALQKYECPYSDAAVGNSSLLAAKSARGKYDIKLSVTDIYTNGDWFLGTAMIYVFDPASPPGIVTAYDYGIEFYYEDCCRLSTVKNGNNDQWFRIQGVISRTQKYSPVVQGAARVRLRQNKINRYWLFAIHPEGNILEYYFVSSDKSRLPTKVPYDQCTTGCGPFTSPWPYKTMDLNTTTGIATWQPYTLGLYAVGFAVVDTGFPPPTPGAGTPVPLLPGKRAWLPLDFIFEVTDQDGPYFTHPFHEQDPRYDSPTKRVVYFNVNNQRSFEVCARDDLAGTLNQSIFSATDPTKYAEDDPITFVRGRNRTALSLKSVTIDRLSGPPGPNENWDLTFPLPSAIAGRSNVNPGCKTQMWRPDWGESDQVGSYLAYATITGSSPVQSIGLYQVLLKVQSLIIYVSGILRDFHNIKSGRPHPDFGINVTWGGTGKDGYDQAVVNSLGPGGETTTGLVSRFLSPNGKPTLRAGNIPQSTRNKSCSRTYANMPDPKPPTVVENCNATSGYCDNRGGFYDWFVTDKEGFENYGPGATADNYKLINNFQVYSVALAKLNLSLSAFTFFARDFYPIDNQLLGNEGDAHNFYFTWEIKTFLTYTSGDKLRYESTDDMWVFVDGILPVSWPLGGIPPATDPATRLLKGFDLKLDLITPALINGSVYRVDIFYAHRSTQVPGIKIELPDFSVCDGISEGAVTIISIPSFTDANKFDFAFGNGVTDATFFAANVTIPGFADKYQTMQLLKKTDTKSSVWYHERAIPDRTPTPVKLLAGFETEFGFIVKCGDAATNPNAAPCAEGFAFVMHKNTNPLLTGGGGGSGLGYSGERVFAIEFDMDFSGTSSAPVDYSNYTWNTSVQWSEISFHTRYYDPVNNIFPFVEAIEDAKNSRANTNIKAGIPKMDFSNGTYHSVKIVYLTGQKTQSGVQQPGYIRVYVNQNLAPLSEIQIEKPSDLDTLLGGAGYVGFTASNTLADPGRKAADIYITHWTMKLVTTSAANTDVPSYDNVVTAGNTGCAIVQAKDICGKDILVGGEAEKFRAYYQRTSCPDPSSAFLVYTDPKLGQQGFTVNGPDVLGFQPVDNKDGTYTFCYNPTVAGTYQLYIKYLEKGTYVPIYQNDQGRANLIPFRVVPAPVSAPDSKFRLPLPNLPWNYNMVSRNGIYARIFTGHGLLLPTSVDPGTEDAHVYADVASLNAYLTKAITNRTFTPGLTKLWNQAKNDLVVFTLAGSISVFNPTLVAPALPAACFDTVVPTSLDATKSWACIVEKTSSTAFTIRASLSNFTYAVGRTPRDSAGDFQVFYNGKDQRTSTYRRFTIAAESAIDGCGSYGRIGSFHIDDGVSYLYRVPSYFYNTMTVESYDRFGNLDQDGSARWALSLPSSDYPILSPTYFCGDGVCNNPNAAVGGLESCFACPMKGDVFIPGSGDGDCIASDCPLDTVTSGFYKRAVAGNRAGLYTVYADVAGSRLGNPAIGGAQSPYFINFEPGPACLAQTSIVGTGQNPTAGIQVAQIVVVLADCVGNQIKRDREEDVVTAQLVAVNATADPCPAGYDPVPVQFEWKQCDPISGDCILFFAYTPTRSTLVGRCTWDIVFTVNGETGPKGSPIIRPNRWEPSASFAPGASSTSQPCLASGADGSTYGILVRSGVPFECVIQSKDGFNNLRWGPNTDAPFNLSDAPGDYAATASPAVSGPLSVQYANGGGQYYLRFTPLTASTVAKDLSITVTGTLGGVTSPMLGSPFNFTVLPGAPAAPSQLADSVAVTLNSGLPPTLGSVTPLSGIRYATVGPTCSPSLDCDFIIVSRDSQGNLRYNAFGQQVIANDDYSINLLTYLSPAQTGVVALVENASLTGVFKYTFTQTAPAAHYKLVALTKSGTEITNSPFGVSPPTNSTIYMDPAEMFGPETQFEGEGLSGCVTGSIATFYMTLFDIYGNNEVLFSNCPTNKMNINIRAVAGAVAFSISRAPDSVENPNTNDRYLAQIKYNVSFICPTGNFNITVMFNNSATKSANCSDYDGLTACQSFCSGQTFGQCGLFRKFEVTSFDTTPSSQAVLMQYQSRPDFSLLRVGQTTNTQPHVVNWWYIYNNGAAAGLDTDFFTLVLTKTTDPTVRINIPRTSISPEVTPANFQYVRFKPVDVGVFRARLFYKGVFPSLNQPDLNITIISGEVSASKSDVFWSGQRTIIAGAPDSFTVTLVDDFFNIHPAGYCVPVFNNATGLVEYQTVNNCDNVSATFATAGVSKTVQCRPHATDTSKYQCAYNLTKAGAYRVYVYTHLGTSDNLRVENTQGFELLVVAGPPHPVTSYFGEPLPTLEAGKPTTITLYLKDQYGNDAVVDAAFNFSAAFLTGTGSVLLGPISGSIASVFVTPRLIDVTTRVWDSVNKWSNGNNKLALYFNGVAVTGTSVPGVFGPGFYQVTVVPGGPCSTQSGCQTAIICPPSASAGASLQLTLRVYDTEGNAWKSDLSGFPFSTLSPTASSGYQSFAASSAWPSEYNITIAAAKTKQANYKSAPSGVHPALGNISSYKYQFLVVLQSSPLVTVSNQGDGQHCVVSPTITDLLQSQVYYYVAATSTLYSTSFPYGNPGDTITYFIEPRDQYGNFRTQAGGADFTMGFDQAPSINGQQGGAVSCDSESGIIASVPITAWTVSKPAWNNILNGFTYIASTTLAGVYTVSMDLNGAQATCESRKGWIQTICAGRPDAAKSFFSVDWGLYPDSTARTGYGTVTAGTVWAVDVTLRDAFANPIVASSVCPAYGAAVRVDNLGVKPLGVGTNVDSIPTNEWIRNVAPDPKCKTLFVATCSYTLAVVQVSASSVGKTKFTINVTEAKKYPLVPSLDVGNSSSAQWTAIAVSDELLAWDRIVTVVPNNAVRFTLTNQDAQLFNTADEFLGTAAVPQSFVLFPADWWLNSINDASLFTFTVRFDIDSTFVAYSFDIVNYSPYYSKNGSLSTTCNANNTCDKIGTRATYLSSWHGPFTITAAIFGVGQTTSTWAETLQKKIYHATCKAEFSDKPYRCADLPDRRHSATCSATYATCAELDGEDKTRLTSVRCQDGSYESHPLRCPCPTNHTRIGATGVCYKNSLSSSVVISACPIEAPVRCPIIRGVAGSNSSQCRVLLDNCPSVRQCPPGFVVCSDGVTCARAAGPGPTCPKSLECPAGLIPCWDGHCRSAVEDCPTTPTCNPPASVLCSDGSCRASRDLCPDQYNCWNPEGSALWFTCPDGSCRSSREGCPSKVTCPIGQLLCESGACVTALVDCPAILACELNQTRCPDGSCRNNLLFCPPEVTCRPEVPVMCPDGQCVNSVTNCATPPVCPDYRCGDGYCVKNPAFCPTPKTCPREKPVLCQDGGCVIQSSDCDVQQPCPPEAPTRCPDNACRTNILLCPTAIVCPQTTPVKCSDSQCVVAIEACGEAPACTNTRCPGGECALARDLCPTHLTCPYDTAPVRCSDGTCRVSLAACPTSTVTTCDGGFISCPQASIGVPVCATRLENCPTNMICPPDRQVRCMDASCAPSTADCPPIPTYPEVDSLVPCADGTWSILPSNCVAGFTCSVQAPFKCWDGSCRVSTNDCPVPSGCAGGYLCPTGVCSPNAPWENCATSATPCPLQTQVRCETVDPGSQCVASGVTDPPGVAYCPPKYFDCSTSLATCDASTFCPAGQAYYCKDGSCRSKPGDCPQTVCPGSVPFLCANGACAETAAKCLQSNGCPARYTKCTIGICVQKQSDCQQQSSLECPPPNTFCTTHASLLPDGFSCADFALYTTSCSEDGSCALSPDNCPQESGCFKQSADAADPFRCADGTCVPPPTATTNECKQGDLQTNVCPANQPYRCADGFCAVSSTFCPILTYFNPKCSGSTPIQCADGSCASQDLACPLVKPCATDEMRCGDGTCRKVMGTSGTHTICPSFDSCPDASLSGGIKTVRCRSGLCSPVDVDGLPTLCSVALNGCPLLYSYKCSSGVCATSEGGCPTNPPSPSGCPVKVPNPYPGEGPVKCTDGSCADKLSLCRLGNGCLVGEVRCPLDGSCVDAAAFNANNSMCPTSCPTPNVKCADGSCKSTMAQCTSAGNGCPLTDPIRCADGTCRRYAAGTVTTAPANLVCQPIVVCSAGRVLCADGSCAATSSLCPSVSPCASGLIRCRLNWNCTTVEACDPAITKAVCPQTAKVQCTTGECRTSISECTGGTFGGGMAPPPCNGTLCFDGVCYSTQQKCVGKKAAVQGVTFKGADAVEGQLCQDFGINVLCGDGRCVSDPTYCNIIQACPTGQARCKDGSCGSETFCATVTVPPCSGKDNIRCEDGFCRKQCLPYDGCGINPLNKWSPTQPFYCANRKCVSSSSKCTKPVKKSRRVLAQTSPVQTSPCYSNCFASMKALVVDIGISSNTKSASTFTIATGNLGETVMTLTIPSGAITFLTADQNSILKIRPVGESEMRDAINPIHISRRNDPYFEFDDVLTFPETVVSPAFQCEVPSIIKQPFQTNFTVISSLDSDRYARGDGLLSTQDYVHIFEGIQDVCLAKLIRRKGYSFWSCLYGQTELRRLYCAPSATDCKTGTYTAGLVWDPKPDASGWPQAPLPQLGKPWKGASAFNRCIQDEGVELGMTTSAITYAFITNPLQVYKKPTGPIEPPRSYALWILFGALLLMVILCCGFYTMFRLSRYRKKYKETREMADRLAEEMENMEHFGVEAAALKAGDVVMSSNPLAQQITSLVAAVDDSELKLQQAEQQLQIDEAGVRKEHIENMTANRDKMLQDLAKLKAQLAAAQAQQSGGATLIEEGHDIDSADYSFAGSGHDHISSPSRNQSPPDMDTDYNDNPYDQSSLRVNFASQAPTRKDF